ncbi:MAG TPA: hypothetical protein GXZ97_09065 [Hydrogenispora sp.]|nr:hypothetical protein [Hydrogenispora sp.]
MDRVINVPPFKIKQKFIKAGLLEEYKRQVKGQEVGLNRLTIEKFLTNRTTYISRLEEQKLAGKIQPSGRDPKGSTRQQSIREETLERKIREFKEQGLKSDEAKERANAWIKTQAVLHEPDQIAGGDPENITGLGDKRVNSSIGAQWKTRAIVLENAVNDYITDKKLSKEDLDKTYLNVKLSCEVV